MAVHLKSCPKCHGDIGYGPLSTGVARLSTIDGECIQCGYNVVLYRKEVEGLNGAKKIVFAIDPTPAPR